MSWTRTSTSTSSKLAGKLTLSGGSIHPSHRRRALDRRRDGRRVAGRAQRTEQDARPLPKDVTAPARHSPPRHPPRPTCVPASSVQFHQRGLNLNVAPATSPADIITHAELLQLTDPSALTVHHAP